MLCWYAVLCLLIPCSSASSSSLGLQPSSPPSTPGTFTGSDAIVDVVMPIVPVPDYLVGLPPPLPTAANLQTVPGSRSQAARCLG